MMACGSEKQSVQLVRMPSSENVLMALMPSSVSGTFTTTLSAMVAMWRALREHRLRMSIAVSSAETSPGVISQMVQDVGVEVADAGLEHQRRVRRDAIEDAHVVGLADLVEVGRCR